MKKDNEKKSKTLFEKIIVKLNRHERRVKAAKGGDIEGHRFSKKTKKKYRAEKVIARQKVAKASRKEQQRKERICQKAKQRRNQKRARS